MFAEPWLCRKRKGRIFFTLLSSLKRLRLRNRVGCLAIDLEIKPFFVHLTVSLPVYTVQLHVWGNAVNMPVLQGQRDAYTSRGFRLSNSDVGNSHSSLVFWVCCRVPLGAQGNVWMTKLS